VTEILDIYDDQLNKTGTKERPAVHRDGDWHRVFQCWVAYRDSAGKDYLVVQRRGPDKDIFPNYLDATAAGHYQAGETIRDGIREVHEELGIDVDFDDMIPLGIRVSMARYNGLIDHEFADVFMLIHNQDISTYAYQVEEVDGLVALPIDEALLMFDGQQDTLLAQAAGFQNGLVELHRSDFIPTIDDCTYKILILAKRALNGEKHLRI
jgi:isopentenyldiphosphate isomerase